MAEFPSDRYQHPIVHLGKDIENRDWKHPPSYRGPILIHAAARPPAHELASSLESIEQITGVLNTPEMDEELLRSFEYGGIIGRARIVDVVRASSSRWFFGPLGFVLADVEPLPFYRCKGQLGFFDVDMSLPPDPEPAPPIKKAKSPIVAVHRQGRLF